MNYPVITVNQAEALNDHARKISPELFWTCNYEPTEAFALSEDARYLANIQDLYKFAVDSGGLLKRFKYIVVACPQRLQQRAMTQVEKVEMLRHAIDHNTSVQNGMVEKARIDAYRLWVRTIVEKNQPDCLADFEKLNSELQALANELLSVSSEMITYANTVENNQLTVQKWRQEILDWYGASAHYDIYEGQLINAYIANSVLKRPNIINLPMFKLRKKVKAWIESRPDYLQDCIDNMSNQLDELRSKVAKADAEKRRKFKDTYEPNILAKISQLQNDLNPYCSSDRPDYSIFKDNLKIQMRCTLEALLSENRDFSLLPGDFLQEDIRRTFDGVPSPENDF